MTEYDTLPLLGEWSGKGQAAVVRWNPELTQKGLRAGDMVRLVLTDNEFLKFNARRDAYLQLQRSGATLDSRVSKVIKHRVKPYETLQDIVRRYHSDLDLLLELNPDLAMNPEWRPGILVRVPVLRRPVRPAKVQPQASRPSMPGPRPPLPPPVPIPPDKSKTMMAHGARQSQISRGTERARYYVVKRGDTAWELATKVFHVSLEELQAVNPDVDLERLRPGMRLLVPPSTR